jgi:hypothetical protein
MLRLVTAAAVLLVAGNVWAAESFVVHLADIADRRR